jgi:predicted O-methyltransferase YrrM
MTIDAVLDLLGANCIQSREEALLLYALVLAGKPRRILEIGLYRGGTALVMAAALEALVAAGRVPANHYTDSAVIESVDPSPQLQVPERLEHLTKWIKVISGRSPEDIPQKTYDFVHIDGDHAMESVRRDLEAVLPRCNPDTVVVFHDTNRPGIRRGVTEALLGFRREYFFAPTFTQELTQDWGAQGLLLIR